MCFLTYVQIAFGIGGGIFTGFIMRLPFFDPYTEDFYQDSNEWNTQHLDKEQIGKIEHDHSEGAHGADNAAVGSGTVEIEMASGKEDERIAALVRREVQRVLAEQQAASTGAASGAAAEKAASSSPVTATEP